LYEKVRMSRFGVISDKETTTASAGTLAGAVT
jgi:hypothetical protein